MSRHIDADRLKKHFEWWEGEEKAKEFKEIFDEIIDAQPTAAVVEVVRCKECKYFVDEGMYCENNIITQFDHFYCYYGERRDNG